MDRYDLLDNIKGWNVLLAGALRTNYTPTLDLVLHYLADSSVKPNLDTFKTIVDGLIAMDERHSYSLAIYDYWREFTKEFPELQPDVAFLNKLLYCCRKCGNMDRAMLFLHTMKQCKLSPNLETFRELLTVGLQTMDILERM